jgi:adenylate cyclase
MSEEIQRRLSAILAADVAGYSRLMGADEAGTLSALRQLRTETLARKVSDHRGKVVKSMGDGWLVEFASVADAVTCAIELQEELAGNESIKLRIGVHLGDITHDDDDIFGDGVNITARLQDIAEPGGIIISDTARRSIDGKLAANFNDLGPQELKNIAEPVTAYGWGMTAVTAETSALPLPNKPSIAVLPFDNMTSDPEHEYFADGISEDIITALSKISRMRVIARNSTFAYKGQAHDLRQVASELGVRYVVEGSVRSGGKRLRITAQLIDASDGSHIWAERFDRTIDDVFDIQDEITMEVVTALRFKLTDGEKALMWARGTNDIEAWQLCIRATELINRWNTTDYLEARALAEKALASDPNFAYAWAVLGQTYWWDGRLGYTGDSEGKFDRANECAKSALALDESLPMAFGLSTVVAGAQNRVDDGVAIARRGFELYPGIAEVRVYLGLALTRAELYADAVEHFRAAISLDPFCPSSYRNGLGRALLLLGEFDEALGLFEEILDNEPTHLHAWLQKAYVLGQVRRHEDAKEATIEVRRLAPDLRLGHVPELLMVSNDSITRRLVNGLREVGLPE